MSLSTLKNPHLEQDEVVSYMGIKKPAHWRVFKLLNLFNQKRLKKCVCFTYNVFNRKAKVLKQLVSWCRLTKGGHTDYGAI